MEHNDDIRCVFAVGEWQRIILRPFIIVALLRLLLLLVLLLRIIASSTAQAHLKLPHAPLIAHCLDE